MTTRPMSIRRRHSRIQRRTLFALCASLAWLASGLLVSLLAGVVWGAGFVSVGVALGITALVMRPRLQRAKADLEALEELRISQETARIAQAEALRRAFSR